MGIFSRIFGGDSDDDKEAGEQAESEPAPAIPPVAAVTPTGPANGAANGAAKGAAKAPANGAHGAATERAPEPSKAAVADLLSPSARERALARATRLAPRAGTEPAASAAKPTAASESRSGSSDAVTAAPRGAVPAPARTPRNAPVLEPAAAPAPAAQAAAIPAPAPAAAAPAAPPASTPPATSATPTTRQAAVPAPAKPTAGQWSRGGTSGASPARPAATPRSGGAAPASVATREPSTPAAAVPAPITPATAVPAPIPREQTTPGAAPAPVAREPSTPVAAPPVVAPVTVSFKPKRAQSITDAFEQIQDAAADAAAVRATPGVSTAGDLAEVKGVFDQVAAVHVAQVRNVMLELRYGDVETSWIESSRPALRSLRTMAARMDLADLCAALDAFCAAVETAIAGSSSQIDAANKDELLERYRRLIELIPNAFELDGERDRREPIIVESLLLQVDGVDKVTIDKLFAAGLGRLDTLLAADAEDLAVVCVIRLEIADAIVARLRAFRSGGGAKFSAADPAAEHRELRGLVATLRQQQDEFERAATAWSPDALERKRRARKLREETYLRIKVALARLGERDAIGRLERLPYNERIRDIEVHLAALARARQGTEDRPWQS